MTLYIVYLLFVTNFIEPIIAIWGGKRSLFYQILCQIQNLDCSATFLNSVYFVSSLVIL